MGEAFHWAPHPFDDMPWALDALCAQVDGDLWYPEKGESTAEAKKICRRCPVRAECLDYAVTAGEYFGVWGGRSERERRRLRLIPPPAPHLGAAA